MALTDLSDQLLLEECRQGNNRSFNVLFRRYFGKLYKYTVSFVKDEMVAEELVMDVMVSLWQKKDDIIVQDDLSAYLYRSAKNALINYWRKKAIPTISLQNSASADHTDFRSADYSLYCKELDLHYKAQLNALSPQRKKVFELSRTGDMTYAEIAAHLNLSVKTVEQHISAVLSFMRKNLKIVSDSVLMLLVLLYIR